MKDSAPAPLMLGRHLIALGVPAGKIFKPVLDACYEAQLDGKFSDEAGGAVFLKRELARRGVKLKLAGT